MIFVIVCLRLTQQDEIERFYTSIHRNASSTAFSRDPARSAGELHPMAGGSIASSPSIGETKRVEEPGAITELVELNGVSSIDDNHTSPV
jgi:hypothetical protein